MKEAYLFILHCDISWQEILIIPNVILTVIQNIL